LCPTLNLNIKINLITRCDYLLISIMTGIYSAHKKASDMQQFRLDLTVVSDFYSPI